MITTLETLQMERRKTKIGVKSGKYEMFSYESTNNGQKMEYELRNLIKLLEIKETKIKKNLFVNEKNCTL